MKALCKGFGVQLTRMKPFDVTFKSTGWSTGDNYTDVYFTIYKEVPQTDDAPSPRMRVIFNPEDAHAFATQLLEAANKALEAKQAKLDKVK